VQPSPAVLAPDAPCVTVDCLPDHVLPGGPLLPIPDQGPAPLQPQGAQPPAPQPQPGT
jgi:hypothetical protein